MVFDAYSVKCGILENGSSNQEFPLPNSCKQAWVQRSSGHPLIMVGSSCPRLTLHTNHSLPLPHPALRPESRVVKGGADRHLTFLGMGKQMGHAGM